MKNRIESNVSCYNVHFPNQFIKAKNALIYSNTNQQYIDFFSSAGSMNYGHNNEYIKEKILRYISTDGIIHALDMDTIAKEEFLLFFKEHILDSKNLDYKVQFCGPTGTNAVEAAIRLSRKVTGRVGVFSLMGSFHGMTLGSLSISSTRKKNDEPFPTPQPVTFIPYYIPNNDEYDPINYMEFLLNYEYSGTAKPSAIIMETVQAESGVNILNDSFLKRLSQLCKKHKILLICDDIQVGCFRTGTFFSFESSGIYPDIVLLSKSISGYGLPLSILLMKPDLDIWNSGEYTGTFRANCLSLVAAKAALEFSSFVNITDLIKKKENIIKTQLNDISDISNNKIFIRGKGMIWGIDLNSTGIAQVGTLCSKACFEHKVIIEVCGNNHNTLKIMPPLTIEDELLLDGLKIIKKVVLDLNEWKNHIDGV